MLLGTLSLLVSFVTSKAATTHADNNSNGLDMDWNQWSKCKNTFLSICDIKEYENREDFQRDCAQFNNVTYVTANAGQINEGSKRYVGCVIEPPPPYKLAGTVAIRTFSPIANTNANITLLLQNFKATTEVTAKLEWMEGRGYYLQVSAASKDDAKAVLHMRAFSIHRDISCLKVVKFYQQELPNKLILAIHDVCPYNE